MERLPSAPIFQLKFTSARCVLFFCLLFLLGCNTEKSTIETGFAPGAEISAPASSIEVTVSGAAALRIKWLPSEVVGVEYKLLRSATLMGVYTEIFNSNSQTEFVDSGLTPGVEYFYKVEYHAAGTMAETIPMQGIAIQGFSITSITASSTRVDFVFPSVAGATSYSLRFGIAPGVYGLEQPITSGSHLSGLTNGVTYYFQIKAKNAFGGLDASSEMSVLVMPLAIQSLEFTTAFTPVSTSADAAFTTQAVITAKDIDGIIETTDSTSTITLAAYTGVGCTGSVVTGGLSGTLTKTLVNGVATFTNIRALKTSVRSIKAFLGPISVCSANLTVSPGAPSQILRTSGNAQSALVGAVLTPFTVTVEDAQDNVIPGATVDWVLTGTGSLSSASSSTNSSGVAASTLTLGPLVGARSVTATVNGTSLSQTFSATALAGAPAVMNISSGASQTGVAGAALSAFQVELTDANGNPLPGLTVNWSVSAGGGTLSSATSNTNSLGKAASTLTLGTVAGANSVTATLDLDPTLTASFSATGTHGTPTQIALTSGNNQSATLTSALAQALTVTVKDANNNLVNSAIINWATTSGTLTSATSSTNSSGVASNALTMGSVAGAQSITATIDGTTTLVTFTATGTLTAPSSLTGAIGDTVANLSFTGATAATSYNIYRSATTGTGFTLLANVTTTTHSDTGLTNGTTYYYIVKALNNSIESAASNEVSVRPAVIPSAPLNFKGTVASAQTVLTWSAPATGTPALTYTIYRSTTSGSGFTALGVSQAALTLTDTGLTNGTTYFYKVAATNILGEGSYSQEIAITPELQPTLSYDFSENSSFQPSNRLFYSEELDRSPPWTNYGLVIQKDAAQDPAGGFTAEKIIATTAVASHFMDNAFSILANQTVTGSVYLKKAGSTTMQVWLGNCATWASGNCPAMSVNLNTGVLSSITTNVVRSSIRSVGNSWYRVSITATAVANGNPTLRLAHASNSAAGDGVSGFYAWGAQVETHPGVSRYVKTTNTAATSFASTLASSPHTTISFARADVEPIATVVGSDGKIRIAPHNKLPYSEEFNLWNKSRALVTANATTAPDGTLTADKVIASSSNVGGTDHAIHNNTMTIKPGATYTYSVYLKAAEYSSVHLKIGKNNWTNTLSITVNLSTGQIVFQTVNGSIPSYSTTVTPVGNGWHRVAISFVLDAADTVGMASIYVINASENITFTGDDTSGIYAWGAQFEQNPTPSTYVATSGAARYDSPRYDFDPVTLLPKGIMYELNRTNQILYSSDLSQTEFTKQNATAALSAELAPDGSPAYKLTETTANGNHNIYKVRTGTNETLNLSMYVKPAGRTIVSLQFSNFSTHAANANYNLSTCTVTSTGASNADYTGIQADAQAAGNGWCRLGLTAIKGSTNTVNNPAITLVNGTASYTGDGTSGAYIWGVQLEVGDHSTSYMPSQGTAVNRRVERSEFSAGTWYTTSGSWRLNWQQNQPTGPVGSTVYSALATNLVNNGYYYFRNTLSNAGIRIINDGGITNDSPDALGLLLANPVSRVSYRLAVGYATLDMAASYGGTAVRVAAADLIVPSTLYLGSQNFAGNNSMSGTIKSLQFFNTRLPNPELVRLSGQNH